MTEPMRVDVTGLRACAPTFAGLSAAVGETVRRVLDRVDAEGACWGGDETGTMFDTAYRPALTIMRRALPGLRDGVEAVGRSLLAAADEVEAAESRASDRFGSEGRSW